MEWTPRLTQLNEILGDLVPASDGILKFVRAAGLKPSMITLSGNALDIWSSVIDEARKNNRVNELIAAVLKSYPENPFLKTAQSTVELNYSIAPKLNDISEWRGVDDDTFEVLTMGSNTMLPVHFLEKGIIRSRSVAKIEKSKGTSLEVGTGFLFKVRGIDELLFMTNYHVISDKADIKNTRVIFDYEEDINGNTKASKSFEIDPDGFWYLSPVLENDVTIFQLEKNDELLQYGFLELDKISVTKNDFVNIIQHPAGQLKKISLYHNIVTNVSDRVVQYLTDTMKGSSGAPVFNSNWDVVALHHSGGIGKLIEPKIKEAKYRNEGILINNVIDFLVANHSK